MLGLGVSSTELLRARVARAVELFGRPGAAVAWPNGIGFDHEIDAGVWEFMTRDDGRWSARFIASGDTVPILAGTGATWGEAASMADVTEWASPDSEGLIKRARAAMRARGEWA